MNVELTFIPKPLQHGSTATKIQSTTLSHRDTKGTIVISLNILKNSSLPHNILWDYKKFQFPNAYYFSSKIKEKL